jgi:3-hydroxyisobutyrate dehydrogenase
MTSTVAFFGLGEIGGPVAGRLSSAGHCLLVKNRSSTKQDAWMADYEGSAISSGDDVARADVVISCVGGDRDLRALYLEDEQFIPSLTPGTLVIDHTTASAAIAREIHDAIDAAGCSFLDAPVSGGSVGARNGVLSIMLGGAEDAVARAEPIFVSYARTVSHIGDPGAGQLCKMVNQLCIAGVLQGLAEGLALARAADMDTDRVLGALSGGAAASWQMENRSSFMLSDTYAAGFAARLMHKDLGLCKDEAKRLSVPLPGASVVAKEYEDLIESGFGDEDFSNLHRLMRAPATT